MNANPNPAAPSATTPIAFIGGGNMASALIQGLLQSGQPAAALWVVEPWAEQADRLRQRFGVQVLAEPGPALGAAGLVVWAVKPQSFAQAAAAARDHVCQALQLSVMAGIRSEAIARASGSAQVVRSMPNTPALIGQGMTGLYARPEVAPAQRERVQALLAPTGESLWVSDERLLDAVTALSGSGPAYVFYLIEALEQAGINLGLPADQARTLALGTFQGATALARQSDEPLALLRERVTSKGGTTHAALTVLAEAGVKDSFDRAVQAAARRAQALGDEFGG